MDLKKITIIFIFLLAFGVSCGDENILSLFMTDNDSVPGTGVLTYSGSYDSSIDLYGAE